MSSNLLLRQLPLFSRPLPLEAHQWLVEVGEALAGTDLVLIDSLFARTPPGIQAEDRRVLEPTLRALRRGAELRGGAARNRI